MRTNTPRRCAASSRPEGAIMKRVLGLSVVVILYSVTTAGAQTAPGPHEDIEQVTGEAQRTPEAPLSGIDRPFYQGIQDSKKALYEKYGISWALEDTLIYQAASGGTH